MSEIKEGKKSSEWIGYLITILGIIASAFFKGLPIETSTLYLTCLTSVYIIARAIVKATATKKDDEILQMIYDKILSKIDVKEKEANK